MARIGCTRRPRSREELASWYAEALDDQACSGLSMTEYAEELGVSAATLYQWRRRLLSDDRDSGRAESFGLVEVTVERDVEGREDGAFVVHLHRDRRVDVPRGFDSAELRRLVMALESC